MPSASRGARRHRAAPAGAESARARVADEGEASLALRDDEALDARLGLGDLRAHPLQRVHQQLRDREGLDPVPVGGDDVPRRPLG